jgi:hypothetical protein
MRNDADGDNGRITICLGADRRFAFPLAVTLSSIRATHPGDLCRVFVVADGFDEQSRATVSEAAGGLDLQWFDMKDVGLNCVRLPWPDVVSKATCFRLLLPDLLPLGTEQSFVDLCRSCGQLPLRKGNLSRPYTMPMRHGLGLLAERRGVTLICFRLRPTSTPVSW